MLYIREIVKCAWSVEAIYVCFFSLLKRVLVGIWASGDKKNKEKQSNPNADSMKRDQIKKDWFQFIWL